MSKEILDTNIELGQLRELLSGPKRSPTIKDGQPDLLTLLEERCVRPTVQAYSDYEQGLISQLPVTIFLENGLPTTGKTHYFNAARRYMELRFIQESIPARIGLIRWEIEGEQAARDNGIVTTPPGQALEYSQLLDVNRQLVNSLYQMVEGHQYDIIMGEFPVTALRVDPSDMRDEAILGRPLGYHMEEAASRKLPPFDRLTVPYRLCVAALTPDIWLHFIIPYRREAIKECPDLEIAKKEFPVLGIKKIPSTVEELKEMGRDGASLDEINVVQSSFLNALRQLHSRYAQGFFRLINIIESSGDIHSALDALDQSSPLKIVEGEIISDTPHTEIDADDLRMFPLSKEIEGLVIEGNSAAPFFLYDDQAIFAGQAQAWKHILRVNFMLDSDDIAILRNAPTLKDMGITNEEALWHVIGNIVERKIAREKAQEQEDTSRELPDHVVVFDFDVD